jgi:hypothetical protein
MYAFGMCVPHFLIFLRKKMNSDLFYGSPPGTTGHARNTGYMTALSEAFR